MRYFAMIGGEQRGPYELTELSEAGVTPETYVWCKGMADWQPASDVADICRFYRQRIFDLMHPSAAPAPDVQARPEGDSADNGNGEFPIRFSRIAGRDGDLPEMLPEEPVDTSVPPASMLVISILLTLFCFPFTGFVAIYYSVMSRKAWEEARRSVSRSSSRLYTDEEREDRRILAHDYARAAKMWAGITFFLGLILYAFMVHKVL